MFALDKESYCVEEKSGVDATIRERAWSSPIWYTPDPKLVKQEPTYPHLHQVFK